ncbi:3-oxoadipate enol-lactonase [Frankia sp. Cr2]|uniref:bifunctional 3-oxoadipate enol-lactonase/4-carboxymuconolactone decarboxylase PcaDC n=1 Tax=Frankia sp. Cr2 TaxID=3073932 RepID=UPI002AD51D3B|nr:3-oxoadipate enol-lactonase [Frankia sp. Cr2]
MTITLHSLAEGPRSAPVLVLLNSIGASTAMWDPQVAVLAERFRVVRIDSRGHGRSPAAPPGQPGQPCTIDELARDVLAVLDRIELDLGVTRVHLAGLSLGGMTAMWIAAHHPQRIARLALLCTSAHLPPAKARFDRAATVRRDGLGPIADAVVQRWVTPGLAARDPGLVAALMAMLRGTDAESYAQCCEAIATMDLRPDLARIAAPTLVIAGSDDPAIPPEHAQTIADGIAGARVEVLGNAAHLATVERSGEVARLLLEHFCPPDGAGPGAGGATLSAGYATRRAVLGDEHVDRAIANTTELTALFQDFITRYAWGDVWSRPGLTRRDRSIVTLAALTSLGADHEIAMHVRAAIRNGLTPAEIGEVLLHTALYSGLPRSNRAFAIAQQTLAELDASVPITSDRQ